VQGAGGKRMQKTEEAYSQAAQISRAPWEEHSLVKLTGKSYNSGLNCSCHPFIFSRRNKGGYSDK